MTRVLQISNYYYPNIGGIEQVARDIVHSLTGCVSSQKVLCFNSDASDGTAICHRKETVHDQIDDIEIIRCGVKLKISSQSLSLSYGRELKNVMNSYMPEIVIMHCPNPFAVHYLLKYMNMSTKLVVYWHSDIVKQKLLALFFRGQTERLLKRADCIVATSPDYIEGSSFLTEYKEKCRVIPNCIDDARLNVTDLISKKSDDIRKANNEKIICFSIGRHVKYKGIGYLIDAASKLDDRIQFYIGGTGPLTESLKESVNSSNITFLGRVSDDDLVAYYSACDIFCFPSIAKNEAFGIALAEAMYFGKPAVTFRIPGSGVNYVNRDKVTGINCTLLDTDEFAAAIKTLAEDTDLRRMYGNNARQRVIGELLFDRFKQSIRELINELNG
jgi:rhamnosyl/mannosyltransferase